MRLRTITFTLVFLVIGAIVSGFGAGSAQAKYNCDVDTRLGGGKDRAVIVGVRCDQVLIDLDVSSKTGPIVPYANAWTATRVGKKLCRRTRAVGTFSGGCDLLFRLNLRSPQRVFMAVRVEGDRCSGRFILGIGADDRCDGACGGVGTGENMRMPRPRGCG